MPESRITILLICILGLLISSCKPKELSIPEYLSWVTDTDHGLHIVKTSGDLICDIQFKPAEYIASKEALHKQDPKAFYEQRLQQLSGMDYIDLTLYSNSADFMKSGVETSQDYQQHLYYFSFGFQNDIKLKSAADVQSCEMYHFERSYDLKKGKRFLLGFPKKDSLTDKILIIDSPVLGAGIIKIRIAKESFQNIPKVKI
jgi:hypothetical protein